MAGDDLQTGNPPTSSSLFIGEEGMVETETELSKMPLTGVGPGGTEEVVRL